MSDFTEHDETIKKLVKENKKSSGNEIKKPVKDKQTLGHIGFADNKSEEGVVDLFTIESDMDDLFKGKFVIISDGDKNYLGKIIKEPKHYPETGKSTDTPNTFSILEHEKVKYVSKMMGVSSVDIIGELSDDLKVRGCLRRPKPASAGVSPPVNDLRKILNIDEGDALGNLIGYEENPIPFSLSDKMCRKHIGIFGMTGSGKSNTVLRLIENLIKKGYVVIVFDWLGEYIECDNPSVEEDLFHNSVVKKMGLNPKGIQNVEVLKPCTDKSGKGNMYSLSSTTLWETGVLDSIICREEAQFRALYCIKDIIFKKKLPKNLSSIIKEIDIFLHNNPDSKVPNASSLAIIKARAEIEMNSQIWDKHSKTNSQLKLLEIQTPSNNIIDLDPEYFLKSPGKLFVFNFKDTTEKIFRLTALELLKRMFEYKYKTHDDRKIMIGTEESHELFPNGKGEVTSVSTATEETIKKCFKIGRHYNMGLFVISQQPRDIPNSILSQINTKIIHVLHDKSDIDKVATGKAYVYKHSIPRLGVGESIITSVECITPLIVKILPSQSKKIDSNFT